MKLNKKGWGLGVFLVFIALFIICLLSVAIALRAHGLLDENWNWIKPGQTTNKKDDKTDYSKLEDELVIGTKKYIEEYYNNNLGLDTLNIKVKSLVDKGFIDEPKDKDGSCSGYVSVYLNSSDEITFKPYLKCKKYETKGYTERHDG